MKYKQLKWLILFIPTVTIGLWEYIRHTSLLLPHISMELGNWLAPVIVLIVTLTLVRRLFRMMEETQEALQRERLHSAAMVEREQLAYELHDGIAQSLFLLSVKLDRLDNAADAEDNRTVIRRLRETVRRIHDDVRQSIAGLRSPAGASGPQTSWTGSLLALAEDLNRNGGPEAEIDWRLPETLLNGREKVELLAIMREALLNAHKHADARRVSVFAETAGHRGFRCVVRDDGRGVRWSELDPERSFGIRMMRSRAETMGWLFDVRNGSRGGVEVEVVREGSVET